MIEGVHPNIHSSLHIIYFMIPSWFKRGCIARYITWTLAPQLENAYSNSNGIDRGAVTLSDSTVIVLEDDQDSYTHSDLCHTLSFAARAHPCVSLMAMVTGGFLFIWRGWHNWARPPLSTHVLKCCNPHFFFFFFFFLGGGGGRVASFVSSCELRYDYH